MLELVILKKYIYHRKLYLRHRRLQNDMSDRVHKACAREVRKAHELFGCIKTALANEEACREKDENYTDCKTTRAGLRDSSLQLFVVLSVVQNRKNAHCLT